MTISVTASGTLLPSERVNEITSKIAEQLCGLTDRGVRLLFVYTDRDHAKDYFEVLVKNVRPRLESSGNFCYASISRSDHTFSLLANQRDLFRVIENWIGEGFSRPPEA